MIDTHTHIDDNKLSPLLSSILKSVKSGAVEFIINNASDKWSLETTFTLASTNRGVYAALGCHPHTASQYNQAFEDRIIELSAHPKVVAIGEIGLDYYRDLSDRALQRKVFERQLLLSGRLKLPVCLHVRDAYQDTYDILARNKGAYVGGVVHCFSGSREMAERFADLGLYFGFGGPITFSNANKAEVIKAIPRDKLLTETDCPYLAPQPKRGEINRPEYVRYVVEKLAEILEESNASIEHLVRINALRLFDKIQPNSLLKF